MGEYDLYESPSGDEIRAINPQVARALYPDWVALPHDIEQERREAEGEG